MTEKNKYPVKMKCVLESNDGKTWSIVRIDYLSKKFAPERDFLDKSEFENAELILEGGKKK